MTVVHAIHSNRFTQIDNDILRDERLSFRAHGLHSYLLSFPPDWHFDLNWIADRVKDGISAIRSAIDELINFGYVRRVITRSPSGQFQSWDYEVYERPLPIDPLPEGRKIQQPEPAEQLTLPLAKKVSQPLSGLPQMGEPFMGDRTHINNEFHEEEFKKDLSLPKTKNVERENLENFSNNVESPDKTSPVAKFCMAPQMESTGQIQRRYPLLEDWKDRTDSMESRFSHGQSCKLA
jgi:hypothetical protein